MPNDKIRGTTDRRTSSTATADHGNPDSGTAAPEPAQKPAPIILTVSKAAGTLFDSADVFSQFHRRLGIESILTTNFDDLYAPYNDFRLSLSHAIGDFENRSKKRSMKLYFTLPKTKSWDEVRKYTSYISKYVRVQNEFQFEDERRAQAKRREDERREKEEEERATAARLAQEEAREREEKALHEMFAQEVQKIIKEVMWWDVGTLWGMYNKYKFITVPASGVVGHKNQARARTIYNSASDRRKIASALRDIYDRPFQQQVIYERNIYAEGAKFAAQNTPQPPGTQASTATVDCEELLYTNSSAYQDCLDQQLRKEPAAQKIQGVKQYGDSAAATLEMINPANPTNLAMAGVGIGVWVLGARLIQRLNLLRKAGQLSQVMRRSDPTKVIQLSRLTTKTGKIDNELLRQAWKYRSTQAGSGTEEAFFRNFMVARVEVNGTARYSRGLNVPQSAWHSENELQILVQELRQEFGYQANIRVKQLFTERRPCPNCQRILDKEFPETQIFYAVDREADRADALFNYYYDATKL